MVGECVRETSRQTGLWDAGTETDWGWKPTALRLVTSRSTLNITWGSNLEGKHATY